MMDTSLNAGLNDDRLEIERQAAGESAMPMSKRLGRQDALQIETVIIGGGQAGLSVGYQLAKQHRPFVILDAHERIGDAWRKRWDSLHLFTPARYDGLAGMPFPAPPRTLVTKDAMADYLEAYAARFQLPVRTGTRVDRLTRHGDRFNVAAGDLQFEAQNVVVAMANTQRPKVPSFAQELAPGVVQLHSSAYRNASQLGEGGVLVVGMGNSGAEIALEAARDHPTWISGTEIGHIPFRIEGVLGRFLLQHLVRFAGHHILTLDTPIGRKVSSKLKNKGRPLVRVKPQDITAAGVVRVPRTVGIRDGLPLLEDGRVLDVANVIWCTGFQPDFSWIDLAVIGKDGQPMHERGLVASEPGLYFVGLDFLYAATSETVTGVTRDAKRITRALMARSHAAQATGARQRALAPALPR